MPQAQTVDLPKRLPLVLTPENRDSSPAKDAKLVNCYSEKTLEGDYQIYKRVGTARSSQPSGGAANGYGTFNWLNDIYAVFGAKLYKNGSDVSGIINLDTTNGVYRFSASLGATPKLQLGNGVKAYNYNVASGLVLITDGDFPASFVKGWSYLDGTTYVGRPDAGIQGSDINTPTSWDPLNVIIAQIEPDRGVALAKQLVYTIMFKTNSTEVFYDAGNASGSPLGAVQGAKVSFGCASADSVRQIDGILFWICTNDSGNAQVMKMEGLKADIVSTDAVEKLLDGVNFTTETVFSMAFKDAHRFYILTFKTANITLCYDIDEKMWSQWTDTSGNYFPFVSVVSDAALDHYFQHETDGYIYTGLPTTYTDNGAIITCDLVTPNFDGGTNRRKQLNALKFICDQTSGSKLQVRSNDNDYGTKDWSNFRYVDLSQKQPMLTNCGTFVRRAYHFRHQSQTAFRMRGIELQMDLGTL